MSSERTEAAADSDRLPTGRLDRFLIPSEQVPAALEARVREGSKAAPTRPAATVVLARDAAAGPEVLLVRRPGRSSFAANAWVFPGGRVDAQDADAGGAMLGRSPEEWGARLDLPSQLAVGYVAAALREAWEETGILLADRAVDGGTARAARAALLRGEIALPAALDRLGARLDAGGVAYIAHWITPEPELRRYDTRFFLAAVPSEARCELIGDELVEARWAAPSAAVDEYAAGTMRLLPPTVHTLRRLAAFTDVGEMVDSLRDAPVDTVLPRMRLDPDGVVIELPG